MVARRIAVALLAVGALIGGLTACGDDHKGQHCTSKHPETTYILVGHVMMPITNMQCDHWELNK